MTFISSFCLDSFRQTESGQFFRLIQHAQRLDFWICSQKSRSWLGFFGDRLNALLGDWLINVECSDSVRSINFAARSVLSFLELSLSFEQSVFSKQPRVQW